MKRSIAAWIVTIMSLTATVSCAIAGPATDALSTCVADNTTGKDRKDLAQWVFVTMSAHPEIQPLSHVTDANRDELDRKLAALATRLVTESCLAEAKAAIKSEGPDSFKVAFAALGQLAMRELMTNPSVSEAFGRYVKYLDNAKFEKAFADK
jgi:hypothetical protein